MLKFSTLPAWAAIAVTASACAFVEAAGEITFGAAQKIPRVATDLKWPGADQLLGNALTGATGDKAPPGLPKSLGSATLAHVQGIMTIDGQCKRTAIVPKIDSKASASTSQLRNLAFTVLNCGDPTRCVEECKSFRGMKVEARIQFQLLTPETGKKITEVTKSKGDPDAIVQIRAQFFTLDYYQAKPGGAANERMSITNLFSASELGLSSVGGGDETIFLKQRYLPKISAKTPQRFEIDGRAEFTRKTKMAVIAGQTLWIEIFQRLEIPQENLYAITLGGGGVDMELQPEFVVSAIKVAHSAL